MPKGGGEGGKIPPPLGLRKIRIHRKIERKEEKRRRKKEKTEKKKEKMEGKVIFWQINLVILIINALK